MKFEKFMKKVTVYGQILRVSEDEKWVAYGDLIVKIPITVRAIGNDVKPMPEFIRNVIDECNNDIELDNYITDEAFLYKAELKDPAGASKDIIRVFKTEAGKEFELTNFEYSLIEKANGLRYYENDDLKALVVYSEKNRGSVEALIVKINKEEN